MSRARDTAGIIQYNQISFDSNNAVGIGSSIPDTKLDVNGGMRVTGIGTFENDVQIADKIVHTGDTDTAVRFPAADTFTVETGGIEALRVTGAQRIGINTDDPTRAFEVYDDTNAIINLKSTTQSSVIFSDHDDINIGMLIYEHSSDSMQFRVNDAERVRIDSSGNVGIGSDNPASRLHISDSSGALIVNRETDAVNQINFRTLNAHRGSIGANSAACFTVYDSSSAERLRVDSSGRLGIGTAAPSQKLHVYGGQALFNNGSDFYINSASAATVLDAKSGVLRFDMNGTEEARIDSSGRLLLGTTTEGSTSADNLTIEDSGHCGVTIRSGTTSSGSVYFSDATSGDGEYEGYIQYNHSLRQLNLGSRAATRLIITDEGADFNTTGSLKVPVGTTAERPTGVAGDFRYNSTTGGFEGYTTEWGAIAGGGGITSAFSSPSGITTHVYLSDAQEHKFTCSGITTISCVGGVEGESHTIRIINSGITTVGFSTFFLFPSGAAPSLPTADGAISLISFTVNRVGAAGTQLLAGASVNFS